MAAVAVVQGKIRLSRKARLARTGILLALVITAANQLPALVAGASASDAKVSTGSVTYVTVRSGDTLWSLAQRYAPNTDPREWIDQVDTINNLGTAGVFAGERLAVPSN